MFKLRNKILAISFFGLWDSDGSPTEAIVMKRLQQLETTAPLTPWERVKFGLSFNEETNEFPPHVGIITGGTITGVIAGAFYGGMRMAQKGYADFVRTNQATKFLTHLDAKRRLQDRIYVNFFNGAWKLGWRTGLFMFMFTSVSNVIILYRNHDGILEYSIGGMAAGAAYRFHLGIRRIIAGGILGCILGSTGGIITFSMLKLTGLSMLDIRDAQYMYLKSREKGLRDLESSADRDDYYENTPELYDKKEREREKGQELDVLHNIVGQT